MNNRIPGLTFLALGVLVSLGCGCRWFETNAQLQDLYNESEVVLIGRPIQNVNPQKRYPNAKFLGFDVLLKVVSVEKGQVRNDTVLVIQGNDNCARAFYPGEKVIVFGSQVSQLRTWSDARNSIGLRFGDEGRTHYAPSDTSFALYRRLHDRHTTIGTNQCVTFTPDDRLVADFIRAGRRR